jgi:cation diffusion facilitator CzcD-associated flavoprotein CzcO
VPGHWYSLSTDLNPRWQSYYAGQPELRAYWENLWHKYDLAKHTVLGTTVTEAVWNNETQRYTVHTQNLKTKETGSVEAEGVFWAIGGFQGALYPKDVPGRETFKGEVFHSAAWRHDVVLKKKRVAVIGNGCSAWVIFFFLCSLCCTYRLRSAQLIPEISKDPSVHVTNFCRTPQWFVPRVSS